jgi:hypothetical protein
MPHLMLDDGHKAINLGELATLELLKLYASTIEELRKREVVRTANNPVGDYAEWLVSTALGLKLVENSAAGYDAISSEGVRVQIKGRRLTANNSSRQLSVIRNLEANGFDELVAVMFDEHFEIVEAVSIPHAVVAEYSVYRAHVNGHILHARGKLLTDPRVRSLRGKLHSAHLPLQWTGCR